MFLPRLLLCYVRDFVKPLQAKTFSAIILFFMSNSILGIRSLAFTFPRNVVSLVCIMLLTADD
jgi:hypothetical protein